MEGRSIDVCVPETLVEAIRYYSDLDTATKTFAALRWTDGPLSIDHAVAYVEGHVHTNGLEYFWSLLKRTLGGTYVSVKPYHLYRYLGEQAFRFNERKDEQGEGGRFRKVVSGCSGKRLSFREVTGKPCPSGESGAHV